MVPSAKRRPKLWLAVSNAPAQSEARALRPTPEPSLDDAQLLQALRDGDPSAATSLHDRVRPQVDRTTARLLDAWTSMVTARVVYKHIRRRQTERRIFAGVELDTGATRSSQHAGREVAMRSLLGRLRVHLEAIDENKAWTFVLHDVCGYDLREIADITGATVAAAQTRLTRGRREIHERIAADPELAGALEHWEEGES
jgi:RNA polymerase sigma-70 factor (ECF subfamily)